ncbi:MAG TPA: TIGR03668 family PPOX class F420-dependent oxidoreductase [Actinomycetota bacterium]|jgi:PPOX class probable F420-dependent enzyme|nr:TIGR03668 family PPOX class F420-dependent oxidoreductase [Actinomycetota bacterium]
MDPHEARKRFTAERVAHLGTVRPDGAPHVVPVVFAVEGDVVWIAVDDKPKRTRELRRLANVQAEPRVSLLVDRYDDLDWSLLWWVRADGRARVLRDPRSIAHAAACLGAKYSQHAARPPAGPAIAIDVERWSGWSAAGVED